MQLIIRNSTPTRTIITFIVMALMACAVTTLARTPRAEAGVITQSEVAPVWSVHYTGDPVLLTAGGYQYVAYYDQDLYLTVAQRLLTSSTWSYRKFTDIQSSWQTGAHHAIAMQIDSANRVHLMAAMHAEALKYYRMTSAHSLSSFTKFTSMVGNSETQVTYPRFLKDAAGNLYLTYRSGLSGNGAQLINRWNSTTATWSRLVNSWFDGTAANQSAYVEGPTLGPDGNFHAVWVWRNSPDVSTNHDVSYAKSADLVNWTTVSGQAVTLPFTPTTPGVVVDPVAVNGGLMNGFTELGFDTSNRATVTYIKYDSAGNSQLYSARYQSGSWSIVKGTSWNYRWNLAGTGAINFDIVPAGGLSPGQAGQLRLEFTHVQYGVGRLVLNETNLQPVAVQPASAIERRWPKSLDEPETVNPPRPMSVDWIKDVGTSNSYVLRWEHGPINGDSAVPQPWPAPTALRVIQLNADQRAFTSDNVARGVAVTASSTYESSGWGAAKLVDGKVFPVAGNGGYSSSSSTTIDHTEWVTIDLGSARTVNAVSLFPANAQGHGMPVDFTIETSTNNTSWTTQVTRNDVPLTAGQQDFTVTPTQARYIRVHATSLRANPADSDQYRLQFAEMQVFEAANLAAGATVSASSTYETSGWGAVKVVNGTTTRNSGGWSSNSDLTMNHPETLTVDLGASATVSRVNMYPAGSGGNFYPLTFTIQLSTNGTTWTTVVTRTNEPVPATYGSYGFTPQAARYVRLNATLLRQWSGDGNRFRAQLAEFEVRP